MHDCFVMSGKESRILKELCSLHLMLTWGIPIEISEIRIISENISSLISSLIAQPVPIFMSPNYHLNTIHRCAFDEEELDTSILTSVSASLLVLSFSHRVNT